MNTIIESMYRVSSKLVEIEQGAVYSKTVQFFVEKEYFIAKFISERIK